MAGINPGKATNLHNEIERLQSTRNKWVKNKRNGRKWMEIFKEHPRYKEVESRKFNLMLILASFKQIV